MYLVTIAVRPEHVFGTVPTAEFIRDLIWSHTRPEDGLEHVSVRPDPDGISVVFFLIAHDSDAAVQTARDLIERVEQNPMRDLFDGE
jgi:hypothetical protein